MPSARDHLGCGMMNGMFVIVGGAYWKDEQKHFTSETIAYSPSTGKWIRMPHIPKPGAYGASAVMRDKHGNEQLLIAGGANADGATSICYRLIKVKGKYYWKPLPNLPGPLWGAKGAVIGSKFYVVGGAPGMDETGIRGARPSLFELEVPATVGINSKWKEVSIPGAPSGRVGSAAAVSGGKLYVFGGYGIQPDGTLGNFGDAYVLDLSSRFRREWKRIKDMPVPSRWTTALALDERHIGLFGGYGENFLDKVLVYDTERDEYLTAKKLPLPVANQAGGVEKGIVYLAGGEDLQRHRTNALFIGK